MIFELCEEFTDVVARMPSDHPKRRVLSLLEEAVRREVHFIDRHPTALFQSMWNACWWYDCDEAAGHYDSPPSDGDEEDLPWCQTGLRLHAVLETWRSEKEATRLDVPWLRAVRPLRLALGGNVQAEFKGHTNTLNSVAVSPDGQWIASAGNDQTVRLWSKRTGRQLTCLDQHDGPVVSVAIAPSDDIIATSEQDGSVRLWDAREGGELHRLRGHEGPVRSVSFSPRNTNLLASGAYDKSIRVWDAVTGTQLACLRGHTAWVESVAFSPRDNWLASGSGDKTIRLWDLASGATRLVIDGLQGWISSVAFSPNGELLASGSNDPRGDDNTVRVWNARTGKEIGRRDEHEFGVTCVAWSADGRRIASSSYDRTIRIWDASNGKPLACLVGHDDTVESVAFSPCGRWLASASWDGTVRVWSTDARAAPRSLVGHEHVISSLEFSADGDRVATGSNDRSGVDTSVRVWDSHTGRCLEVIKGRGIVQSASSAERSPRWQIMNNSMETYLAMYESAAGVAWWHDALSEIAAHPAGDRWAGVIDNSFVLIALEHGQLNDNNDFSLH